MKEYFIEKFKTKSEQELDEIIENRIGYQKEAVLAAIEILNNIRDIQISIPVELEERKEIVRDTSTDSLDHIFNPKPFLKTLSYREFITWFALTLLMLSFFELTSYYSYEYFEDNNWLLNLSLLLLIFLGNHVIYRFENKKSNNFLGRSISDSILLMMIIFARLVYNFLLVGDFSINMEGGQVILMTIVIIFLIFLFEAIVGVLKYLLSLIGCQIF